LNQWFDGTSEVLQAPRRHAARPFGPLILTAPEAEFSVASAALRRSERNFDAAATLAGIWSQGAGHARRWGAVHLRAGREIGKWWQRIKPGRGRRSNENKGLKL
jgi:hypothetical protein